MRSGWALFVRIIIPPVYLLVGTNSVVSKQDPSVYQKVLHIRVYCIFICLGCHVIFVTMQELDPAPVFPLIVGVSVIALMISMPRFAAISEDFFCAWVIMGY
jgi:hypothetical protein